MVNFSCCLKINLLRGKYAKEKYHSYLCWFANLLNFCDFNHDACELDQLIRQLL